MEATCNTHAIAKLLEGRVARVVISNPQKTRAIAEAKVKTDKVDAAVLAQLLAADYLPAVWLADDADACAAPPGRSPRAYRPPAHPVEEPGPGDLASQPDPALPGRRPVRPQGPALAGRAGAARRRAPGRRGAAASAGLPRPGAADHRRRARPRRAGQRRGPAADDDPRRRRDRRAVDRRRGRRLRALPLAGEARQLPRAESAGAPVRRAARLARADHQAGPRARPRDARRGRLGGVQDARARCGRSISACAPAAGCRSRSSRPRASSRCCAGT